MGSKKSCPLAKKEQEDSPEVLGSLIGPLLPIAVSGCGCPQESLSVQSVNWHGNWLGESLGDLLLVGRVPEITVVIVETW